MENSETPETLETPETPVILTIDIFEEQLRNVIVKALKSQIHPENVYAVLHKLTHIQEVLLDANILEAIAAGKLA